MPEPQVPMLEKMKSVKEDSQKLGSFLDWLMNDQGYALAKMDKYGELMPIYDSIEVILAEYFEIDLNQAEDEKRALLDYMHERNTNAGNQAG